MTDLGSIPAQAGEPSAPRLAINSFRVYPRAGGGTPSRLTARRPSRGLSPRRRGNLRNVADRMERHRSIPAQAGEPREEASRIRWSGVYPRAGGGTHVLAIPIERQPGLSPRRRGNRQRLTRQSGEAGSIPAQAGEPLICDGDAPSLWVYPRAGGGTAAEAADLLGIEGLSPRRRGNHRLRCFQRL